MSSLQPTSVRLTKETLALLDEASTRLRRSRSFIVEEAWKQHLHGSADRSSKEAFARLLSLKGAGARIAHPLTEEEIEARAREFRGDD